MRGVLLVTLAAALLVCPARADESQADDPVVEARAHVERAHPLRGRQRGSEAVEAYRRALDVLDRHDVENEYTADVLTLLGSCLLGLRKLDEAREASEQALEILRRVHGRDHGAVAMAINNLAVVHREMGRPDVALPLHEESVAMIRRAHAGDHEDVASCLANLASTFTALRRYEDALRVEEEVLEMARRLRGGDAIFVATLLHNMGITLDKLGRYDEALERKQECLVMRKRLHGNDHPEVARSFGAIARSYVYLHRHADALPFYRDGLAMLERCIEGDHPLTLGAIHDLAYTMSRLGRYEEARDRYRAGLEMSRRLGSGDHPRTAGFLDNLAQMEVRLGRYDEALLLQVQALTMYRRVYRGDHPRTANGLNNLGGVLGELGRHRESLPVYEEALAMRRRIIAGDHLDVAMSLNNLAHCQDALGRDAEALPLFEEALAMRRRLVAGDHSDLALSLMNLAHSRAALGRPEDALPLEEEALAMYRRLHGEDHPSVAWGLQVVASTLSRLGRRIEALPLQETALAIRRKLFDGDHPSVARSLDDLAMLHLALGRSSDALPLEEEAQGILRRFFAADHASVAVQLHNLARVYEGLGRLDDAGARFEEAAEMGRVVEWPDRHAPLVALGRLALDRGDAASAVGHLEEAIAHLEARREDARSLGAEGGARYVAGLLGGDPFALMVEAQLALERPPDALRWLERGRARSLLDLLARGRTDPLSRAEDRARRRGDPEASARLASVRRKVAEAEVALLRSTQTLERARELGRRPDIRGAMEAQNAARRALAQAVRRRLRAVRDALPETSPLPPGEIRALLQEGERMLVYALGRRRSFVFLVAPETIAAHALPGVEKGGILAYAEALSRARRVDLDAGRTLFSALVPASVWDEIRKARRVYVLPHGELHVLPFEALVVDPEGNYWVDAGPPVTYAPSGSVLAALRMREDLAGSRSLVALGDPVFAGTSPAWPEAGVLVRSVTPRGRAAELAMRPGDVIVGYGEHDVADLAALQRATRVAAGTTSVRIRIVRDGVERELSTAPGPLGVRIAREAPAVAGPELLAGDELAARLRSARTRRAGLVPLPGTRREVERIVAAFAELDPGAGISRLLGRDATEAKLYAAAPGARFLHLATHGLVDETQSASFSGLALTMPGIPVPGDDGFLAFGDLLERWQGRLDRTEMVVLSACESRRGRLERDEGMMALPWAFCFAGCRSVVGSLWKVDDESTALLMAEFYRRLLGSEGRDKAKALHGARRAVRATHPDPFHRAPFVFLGDPR